MHSSGWRDYGWKGALHRVKRSPHRADAIDCATRAATDLTLMCQRTTFRTATHQMISPLPQTPNRSSPSVMNKVATAELHPTNWRGAPHVAQVAVAP